MYKKGGIFGFWMCIGSASPVPTTFFLVSSGADGRHFRPKKRFPLPPFCFTRTERGNCTPISCKMVLGETVHISVGVAFFGTLAFIFGVVAETKKPKSGIPMHGKGGVICQYPSDPSILLGSSAAVALFITALLGLVSIFYPYQRKPVPREALFRSTTLRVFFAIALGVTGLACVMMLWATVAEGLLHDHNVHPDPENLCPTAKTGVFGGAAFLALDAMLFWLVCQMLALNARADHSLAEDEVDLTSSSPRVNN